MSLIKSKNGPNRVSSISVMHRITEELIIDSGMKNGEKLPPVRSIAERFGTNQITVMRAIAELAAEGILTSEEKRGVFVRDIRKCGQMIMKSGIIAAILPYADRSAGYYFNEVVRVLEQKAIAGGKRLIVQNLSWATRDITSYIEDFISFFRVAGIIVRVPQGYTDAAPFNRALARGISVVFIDSSMPEVDAPSVIVDNVHGGFIATRHLIDCGHTRIAFLRDSLVDSPGRTKIEADRFSGYSEAMKKAGIERTPALDIQLDVPLASYSGKTIVDRIHDQKITAVFAYNDENAAQLITHLSAHGIRVPEDISVIGFDNITMDGISLSSIDPHKDRMGEEAARLALSENEGSETVIITPDLVVGKSVRHVEAA